MLDPRSLPDEELLLEGRSALKLGRYAQAHGFLLEYCQRMAAHQVSVPPGVIASYGLTLGHMRRSKEGLEMCLKAWRSEPRNPHIAFCLAELYVLVGARRKAVDAVERGLFAAAEHSGLLRLRGELGVRQAPPIRFLPRAHALNVKVGRALRRWKSRSRPAPA